MNRFPGLVPGAGSKQRRSSEDTECSPRVTEVSKELKGLDRRPCQLVGAPHMRCIEHQHRHSHNRDAEKNGCINVRTTSPRSTSTPESDARAERNEPKPLRVKQRPRDHGEAVQEPPYAEREGPVLAHFRNE